ncbi:MAG: glycerophosphodiester phosphodiesterase, partial [Thermoproteales archaeon]|nr:glycerophosphodiester phosphodiesterase [Thermoproteales archaeon]
MFNVYDYLERKLTVQCMAHRGFSGMYPENTLLAFNEAIKINADLIEFDVRVSGDGVPVVIHDASVDRTTDGSGLVSELSVDELKRL